MPAGKLRTIKVSAEDQAVIKRLMNLSVMSTAMRLGFDYKDDVTVLALQTAMMVQGGALLQQECERQGQILTKAELVRKIKVSIEQVKEGVKAAEKASSKKEQS
jgi:hypothetical protein